MYVGINTPLFSKTEGRTEDIYAHTGDNLTPRGQSSPLGVHISPLGVKLKSGHLPNQANQCVQVPFQMPPMRQGLLVEK
jgi:hypothetical protein